MISFYFAELHVFTIIIFVILEIKYLIKKKFRNYISNVNVKVAVLLQT